MTLDKASAYALTWCVFPPCSRFVTCDSSELAALKADLKAPIGTKTWAGPGDRVSFVCQWLAGDKISKNQGSEDKTDPGPKKESWDIQPGSKVPRKRNLSKRIAEEA